MKIKCFMVFLILIFIISIGTVVAEDANFYVSVDGNDTNDGSASSPFATIDKAISSSDASKDTAIYLGEGEFSGVGNTNLNINLNHRDNGGSLSIVGQGVDLTLINGEYSSPIFRAMSSSSIVSIEGISFVNGYANNGGAISSSAELNINNCLFENNYVTGNSGGAIYWQNYLKCNITINNSIFENNGAGYSGGAVYIFGLNGCSVENSLFSDNYAFNNFSSGANLYVATWYSNIIGNTFENTTTTPNSFDGGVNINPSFNGQIINNSFVNCKNGADKYGILSISGNNYLSGNDFTNSYTSVGQIYNDGNINAIISVSNFTIDNPPKNIDLSVLITDINENIVNGGNVEFYVDNQLINTTQLVDSEAQSNYDVSNYKNYEVLVKYGNQSGMGSIVVLGKRNSTTNLSYVTNSDNTITLIATVSADVGNVTFVVADNQYIESISNNVSFVNVGLLAPGQYNITASYGGSDEYNPSSDSLNITIPEYIVKYNSTISLSTNVDNIAKKVDIIAICSSNGTVIFNVNGKEYTVLCQNDVAELVLDNLTNGNYDVIANYSGNNQYNPSINSTAFEIVPTYDLTGGDVLLYFRNGTRYEVKLTCDGIPVMGEIIIISINGVNYTYKSSNEGLASLPLNLNPGIYNVTSTYQNISISNTVTIMPTITGENLVKYFKNQSKYVVSLIDGQGAPLNEGKVEFNINGIFYYKDIVNGYASLSINLPAGNYVITSVAPNKDTISNNIEVLPIVIENNNLTKFFRNDSQYTLKLLDGQGNPVGGEIITFNINGIFYNRTSDGDGNIKMDINLPPGNYIITGNYNGFIVSNTIQVDSVIKSSNLEMSSNNRLPFIVTVLDGQGNPAPYCPLSFNVNGVFYERISDSFGMAKLDINLIEGRYIITTAYDGLMQSNTIVIF